MDNSLADYMKTQNQLEYKKELMDIILQISKGIEESSLELQRGAHNGGNSKAQTQNASGDFQIPLDLVCHEIFKKRGAECPWLRGFVSEESEDIHFYNDTGRFLLVIDPLDGSNNLPINASVATIFSICEYKDNNILKSVQNPISAGICIYGFRTSLSLTVGNGVFEFNLCPDRNEFIQSVNELVIPIESTMLAVNFSNRSLWNNAIKKYVDECYEGENGPRKQYFNCRWYASAAAELNRILLQGGVFLYPACSVKKPKGVLRKVYEAYPMAFIIESAGGMASNGETRMLDIEANELHEKTPFAMGSSNEITRLKNYHQNI